jgi:hypothetical protein
MYLDAGAIPNCTLYIERESSMTLDEQQIYELSSALLLLAKWYEVDAGSIEPLDKVRAYLGTFPIGQRVLKEEEKGELNPQLQ